MDSGCGPLCNNRFLSQVLLLVAPQDQTSLSYFGQLIPTSSNLHQPLHPGIDSLLPRSVQGLFPVHLRLPHSSHPDRLMYKPSILTCRTSGTSDPLMSAIRTLAPIIPLPVVFILRDRRCSSPARHGVSPGLLTGSRRRPEPAAARVPRQRHCQCHRTEPLALVTVTTCQFPQPCMPAVRTGPGFVWRCSHSTSALWWVRKPIHLTHWTRRYFESNESNVWFPGSFG
jgi:hypothetical protein